MGPISNQFNAVRVPTPAANIPPVARATARSFTVPCDKRCGCPDLQRWGTTATTAERFVRRHQRLSADTTGCIDIARSSRDKRDTDPANLEFYAFAKDAVTWARWQCLPWRRRSPAGCAPNSLTQDQLKGIYLCTEPGGLPLYTNWNQVGGDNEPIVRYLPQAGREHSSFFETRSSA